MTEDVIAEREAGTMTDLNHYDEAKDALARAQRGVTEDPQDLAMGQLHAMLAVADELRNIRNELMEILRIADSRDP
jgi:hypothetical protein